MISWPISLFIPPVVCHTNLKSIRSQQKAFKIFQHIWTVIRDLWPFGDDFPETKNSHGKPSIKYWLVFELLLPQNADEDGLLENEKLMQRNIDKFLQLSPLP